MWIAKTADHASPHNDILLQQFVEVFSVLTWHSYKARFITQMVDLCGRPAWSPNFNPCQQHFLRWTVTASQTPHRTSVPDLSDALVFCSWVCCTFNFKSMTNSTLPHFWESSPRCWHVEAGIRFHSYTRASVRSLGNGCLAHSQHSKSSRKPSMGFRSGLWADRLSSSMLDSVNHLQCIWILIYCIGMLEQEEPPKYVHIIV